ncbi:MAG: hypothetical protein ACYSUT_03865 [Planctomycetota bacterium]|jgi:hypothetical protein
MIENERDLGPQPIEGILEKHNLNHHDVVAASTEQITHKMVNRACKGRKLSRKVQLKIRNAVNAATEEDYTLKDLFTY